jgi:dynein heavy chain, axonemal
LRDVSKVFQGILMTKPPKGSTVPTALPQPESMVKIWIHETCRVFYDRLSNDIDRNIFKDNMQKIWYGTLKSEWTVKEIFEENMLVFCDFMRRGLELDERNYEEVKEANKLKKTIDDYMTEEADKPMNLVLFRDAIDHACRICRILRQLRGHAMLIGLGGSGKKALTKLGAVLAGTNVEMVEPKNDYGNAQFRKDLYEKMLRAVTGKKPLCFLFPDTHMIKESFLEDINNLLNSGEVPNLLDKERLAEISTVMPDVMKRDNVNKETYAYWVEKVRSHLHIVLAMSPVGDKLRNRIRMFASLVNCCTIDWINPWPEDALLSVSEMAIKEMDIKM